MDEFTQIITVVGKADSKVIQQILAPWFGAHGIDGVNDTSAHQAMPDPVDHRASEPSVIRMRHEFSQLLQARFSGSLGIHLTKLRKQPFGYRHHPGGFIASVHLQGSLRKNSSQIVGLFECPAIDETVVAARTLHIDPEEHLRNILSKLNLTGLTGIHLTPPLDSIDKTGRVFGDRCDQLTNESIVWHVLAERSIKPCGDLSAAIGNESRSGIIIA